MTWGLLLATTAVWGLNLSAVKVLTVTFSLLTLSSVRMVVGFVTLSLLVLVRHGRLPLFSGRALAGVLLCGFLMVYANQMLFGGGLARTTATNAALILALGPIASATLGSLVFQEPMRARRALGVLLGLGGVCLVILNRPGAELARSGLGDLLMLCSVLCFAGGGLALQRMSVRSDPLSISWAAHAVGAGLLVIHTTVSGEPWLQQLTSADLTVWGLVLFSGTFATGLAAMVWAQSVARLGASRTALAFYWVPIFGVAFAVAVLGEALTVWHLLGLAAVLAGSWLGSR